MVYCCVPFCKSRRGKAVGVSFHEFPTTSIRHKWLKAIRRRASTPGTARLPVESGKGRWRHLAGPPRSSYVKQLSCFNSSPKGDAVIIFSSVSVDASGLGFKGTTTAIWCPSDRSTVCSLHFTDDDYRPGLKLKRLKTDAVPSRFPGYPAHLQSKEKPPRHSLRRTPSEHKVVPSSRKRMGCPPDGLHATTGDEVSQFDEIESSQILRQLESSNTQEAFTVLPLPLNLNGRAR